MRAPDVRSRAPSAFWVNLVFVFIYFAWGGRFLAMHVALAGLSPLLISGLRFFIAGVILLAWLRARDRDFRWGTARNWIEATVASFFLLIAGISAVNWAQQYVASSLAALIFGATPIWITLVDWLRPQGVRPSPRATWGLGLGFLGACVLLAPGAANLSGGMLAAKLVLVTAAISWAIGTIYSRHLLREGSALLLVGRQITAAGALMLVAAWATGDVARFRFAAMTPVVWGAFIYLVLFASLLGFVAYFWLLRVSTVPRVATIPYVNIVIAVTLGCLVNGEPFGWNMVLGGATILGAVVLVMQKPRVAELRED